MSLRTFNFKHGKGRIEIKAESSETQAELLVYGVIGDSWWDQSVVASDVVKALSEISASEILVRINSRGGSVADGVAIHNALRAHGARIITRNEAEASSIASLILMAGDEAQSFPNAMLMVHAPWAYAAGNSAQFREYADILDKLAESMSVSYARKTGKGREHALALMQDGKDHFYTADEAKAEGFIDTLLDSEADDVSASAARAVHQGMADVFALFPDLFQPTAAALSCKPTFAAARGTTTERNMPPNDAPAAQNNVPAVTPNAQAIAAEATASAKAAEAARKTGIREMFALAKGDVTALAKLEADCLADDAVTPLEAGKRIFAAQNATQPTPTGGAPRAEVTTDQRDHFRAGMANAILHRFNPSAHALDERGQKFRGMNLVRMAEESLRANSMNVGYVPGELAAKALHSTSDFPFVLENVITKTLRAAYEGTQRTFVPWTRRATLPDFKQISRVQLGGAPNLKRVVEGGEYEQGTIGEGAEKYAVQKYGRLIAITWETIVNDDLSAFTRVPEMFGRSAADLESDIVYGVLTTNANLADGKALFHADHGNLGTGGAISDTTLSEAREKMLVQKGIEGRYIAVRPEYLIVPPRQLTAAQKAVALPIVPTKTADANTFYQSLNIVAEPRLQDTSATAFYLAASPNAVDTIEYAYLEGYEGVFTESKAGFEMDGMMVKCRHVFGAKAIDYRGLFRNAGA